MRKLRHNPRHSREHACSGGDRGRTLHHGPAFEQFAAAAAGEGDSPDPARLTAIAAAHGIDIVGPPPRP